MKILKWSVCLHNIILSCVELDTFCNKWSFVYWFYIILYYVEMNLLHFIVELSNKQLKFEQPFISKFKRFNLNYATQTSPVKTDCQDERTHCGLQHESLDIRR